MLLIVQMVTMPNMSPIVISAMLVMSKVPAAVMTVALPVFAVAM